MGDNEVTVPKNEMDQEASSSSIKIGLKPFLTGVFIILALIITSGVMTKVIPAGHFERVEVDGRVMVVEGSGTTG